MAIVPDNKLRDYFRKEIPVNKPYGETLEIKKDNINHFNALERDGLKNGEREKRILLYVTSLNEKIYIQYPGKEAEREGDKKNANDFKPVLITSNGDIHADMDFKAIWDIVADMGKNTKGKLDILGAVFLKMAYMLDYKFNDDTVYCCETIEQGRVTSSEEINLKWHSLFLEKDIIDSLNNLFSSECRGISFEAFIYYNDLLAQNEDCKYYSDECPTRGRINNILSHLSVISFFRDKMSLSRLIDGFGRIGVFPIGNNKIPDACGELIVLKGTKEEKERERLKIQEEKEKRKKERIEERRKLLQQKLEEQKIKQKENRNRLKHAQTIYDDFVAGERKVPKKVTKELEIAKNKVKKNKEQIGKIIKVIKNLD